MRLKALTLAVCSIAIVAAMQIANAQDIKPMASPYAEVLQRIGTTDVKITYHRPSVKEREIWGALVPFDEEKPWRTGANNSTEISFSKDVVIEGQELPAGTYTFYALVGKEEWTLIFNKKTGTWGSGQYDKNEDALRVKVKTEEAPFPVEQLIYGFADVSMDKATAVLWWEKLMVKFEIEA
jgi:hypothetical protein